MNRRYDPDVITHPLDVVRSAAIVGGGSAIPGLVTGAFYGTLRTRTPVLFSIISGAQCAIIGTTFWTARSSILNHTGLLNWWNITRGLPIHPRNDLTPSPSDKVRASVVAGAFTGFSLGFLFRGPQNVIPGTIMFSLFGFVGQHGYNYLDARNSRELKETAELKAKGEDVPKETLMQRFAKTKWSPMSVLTDDEYENMLQEKLLRVEAEIAIVDEKIEAFRKNAMEAEVKRTAEEKQKQVQGNKS